MTEAYASNYWISPTALYIKLNALGMPNYIQANTAGGSVIMCHVPEIIGYDDGHNYRRWQLIASPTLFNTNSEKYVYVQIPRDMSKTTAMVVFPSEHIDLYGKNEAEEQIGSADYYYIWLQAKITATDGTSQRTWDGTVNHGTLSTDEAYATQQGEWFKWDAVTQMVTFVKTVFSATINYLTIGKELIFGEGDDQKKVTQIADGTDLTDDSPEHIATPAFVTAFGNGHFLRKDQDDETEYKLTMKEAEVKETLTTKKAVVKDTIASDNFVTGAPTAGSGWAIDHDGNIEGESIKVRGFMQVPEIRFNRASIAVGTNIQSPCAGIIKTVTPESATSGICTLELGDDDIAGSIVAGDYCWGYFHDITTRSNNATADTDDHNGTINYQGFATVYFYIQEVLNQNSTQFRYELKEGTTLHPYVGMHFGGRGNDKDKTRQGFTITTPRYLAIYQLVTGWDWDAASHIVYLQGCLDGFEALANVEAGTWHNKYGIICGDIYFRGTQHQVKANKRYIYITQSSNGMIDPGESETVTIAIRDNYFQNRTEEFTVKVNGTAQTKADEITLTYAYDTLTAEVTKFTIEATDGTYTLTSAFTIRKNPQRTLSIVTNTDNDPFIDQIEPKHIVCAVKNNLGYDLTEQVTTWKIERESSSADADAIWAQRSKVKAFNGTIDLYWSDDVTINDLDLSQPTTKFHIKATIGEEEIQTTLNI